MEKIFDAKLRRKPGYLYFLDPYLNICCRPMNPRQVKNPETRVVIETDIGPREDGFFYFIHTDGNVYRRSIS